MKKLSGKWQIFLIASYFSTLNYAAILFIAIRTFIIWRQSDIDITLIFGLTSLVCLLNSCLCIYIVQKYLPGKASPDNIRILLRTGLFLMIFALLGMFVICVIGITSIRSASINRTSDYVVLMYFMIMLGIGIFCLVNQFQLSSLLSDNNKKNISDLINSIGNDNPGLNP